MSQKTDTQRIGEITIDSNWILMVGMVLLFGVRVLLLIRDIRNLLFYTVDRRVHFFYLLGAAYFFLFAYSFRSKSLKLAFLLLGTDITVRIALSYFSALVGVQQLVAVAGSVARQIAFTIILFEIAGWFKSVIRWTPLRDRGASDS